MPEGAMAVVKPEMKSYIWLQTADGSIQQIEEEVAMFCPVICREILQKGVGTSKTSAVVLPEQINPITLSSILDYCRFHLVPGHSIKERKAFDDKFIRLDTKKLCELTSAADSLQLKPLVDLTSRTLARIIEGKTPEEIRDIFNLPDDLTEEEKLEPLKNVTDDPRIRLLNRLYARKRKELKEREEKKISEAKEEPTDDRSVDDLLSFINSGGKECRGKTKKKNRRKKPHTKASNIDIENHKEENGLSYSFENGKSGPSSEFQDPMSPSIKHKFDEGDIDDELDPAMKEELDREVEDFARRLNSVWPERKQEILSLSQGRKLTSISLSGNGSTQKSKGKCFSQVVRFLCLISLLVVHWYKTSRTHDLKLSVVLVTNGNRNLLWIYPLFGWRDLEEKGGEGKGGRQKQFGLEGNEGEGNGGIYFSPSKPNQNPFICKDNPIFSSPVPPPSHILPFPSLLILYSNKGLVFSSIRAVKLFELWPDLLRTL